MVSVRLALALELFQDLAERTHAINQAECLPVAIVHATVGEFLHGRQRQSATIRDALQEMRVELVDGGPWNSASWSSVISVPGTPAPLNWPARIT